MARISGIELQDKWRVDYALTRLKGIGWPKSTALLKKTGVEASTRLKDLGAENLAKITAELENHTVEGDLVRAVRENIQRLRDISAYRGVRHARGLPARGQRTKSNARTKRGKRKTVGAFKKEMLAKVDAAKKNK
jgi:small subunit ribosomal protein S13